MQNLNQIDKNGLRMFNDAGDYVPKGQRPANVAAEALETVSPEIPEIDVVIEEPQIEVPKPQTPIEPEKNNDEVGTCRVLVADGVLCNTKLVERIGHDYWFCPKCCPEAVRDNKRDLSKMQQIPEPQIITEEPTIKDPITAAVETTVNEFFRFEPAQQFKKILKVVHEFSDEASFTMNETGLAVRQMDASRITMIDLVLKKEAFDEYLAPEEFKFCLNLDDMLGKGCSGPLKNIKKDDSIKFLFNEKNWDIAKSSFTAVKCDVVVQGRLKREWKTDLLELEEEENPVPKISFNAKVVMILADLLDVMKDLEDDPGVKFSARDGTFEVTQKQDTKSYRVPFTTADSLLDLQLSEDKAVANYSVNYLKILLQALKPLTQIVTLEYSTDMPIKISVHDLPGVDLALYVAPRIETE